MQSKLNDKIRSSYEGFTGELPSMGWYGVEKKLHLLKRRKRRKKQMLLFYMASFIMVFLAGFLTHQNFKTDINSGKEGSDDNIHINVSDAETAQPNKVSVLSLGADKGKEFVEKSIVTPRKEGKGDVKAVLPGMSYSLLNPSPIIRNQMAKEVSASDNQSFDLRGEPILTYAIRRRIRMLSYPEISKPVLVHLNRLKLDHELSERNKLTNSITGWGISLTAGKGLMGNKPDDRAIANGVSGSRSSLARQRANAQSNMFGLSLVTPSIKGLSLHFGAKINSVKEKTEYLHYHTEVPFYTSPARTTLLGVINYDMADASISEIKVNNEYQFIEIPLGVSYIMSMGSKIRFGIDASYNLRKMVSGEMSYYDINRFQTSNLDHFKLGAGKSIGGHTDYALTKRIWLSVSYQYLQSKNDMQWLGTRVSAKNKEQRFSIKAILEI